MFLGSIEDELNYSGPSSDDFDAALPDLPPTPAQRHRLEAFVKRQERVAEGA